MENLLKIIESKTLVRFPDCDPFNHLNNSKYIDYILNAREDQLLKNYNFDLYQLAQEQGLSWLVAQHQIAYLLPAYLMETIIIQTSLIQVNEKNLFLEAVIINETKTKLKAILWTKFTHYNLKTMQSENHSEKLMQFLKQIENPLDNFCQFEDRVKYLRKQKISESQHK